MVNLDGMLSLGLTFWVVSMVNDITNVEISNSWVENNELCFNGVISTKCAEIVTNGWKMHLKSSQGLSKLTSTNVTILQSDANSSFILSNLASNNRHSVGDTIRVSFSGCTSQNDALPQISIEFHRNQNLCPKITPPKDRQSVHVPVAFVHDDESTFRASLSIVLPVTVQGNWVIYLAISTRLSQLTADGVSSLPKQGDIFTLKNLHWQEIFLSGATHILEIEGSKATHGVRDPCIIAVFTWEKHMEVHPSTTTSVLFMKQTISQTVQQTSAPTSSQISNLSPSLSDIRSTYSGSTITEYLQDLNSLPTTYSNAYNASSTNIRSSPTTHVQPSSTTTTEIGGTILPHECGDVTVPSGYYHLQASVIILAVWPQGFTGQITFTTTVQVRDGWRIELVMDKVISLSVHIVTTTARSGTRFTLHNKDYNKQLEKGANVTIDFEANKEVNDNVPCMRAVFMWAIEEPCPKIESVIGSNSIDANVSITSQWNEGISGQITLVVPAEIQNGWQMQVLFDIPLTLTVPDAIASPLTAGTQFTLTNKSYNKVQTIGSTLVVTFTATKQEIGSTVLCTDALFIW